LELFKLRASNRFADGVAELSSPDYQRDLVSGLGDRRFGDSRLNAALQDASEGGTLGLLFLDIDNFKDVNDTLGHPTGDRVIHMVGQTLANSVRASDVPVRWGGEEFLVLLPGVTPEELETSAERIRMLVENSFLSHSGGVLQVTVSVGAAMAFPGEGPVALVERADRLMYASKRSGRNRVTSEAGLVPRASSQPLGPGLFKRKVKAS
jgi:diguanylate cyclase (GGDEF)-like protein